MTQVLRAPLRQCSDNKPGLGKNTLTHPCLSNKGTTKLKCPLLGHIIMHFIRKKIKFRRNHTGLYALVKKFWYKFASEFKFTSHQTAWLIYHGTWLKMCYSDFLSIKPMRSSVTLVFKSIPRAECLAYQLFAQFVYLIQSVTQSHLFSCRLRRNVYRSRKHNKEETRYWKGHGGEPVPHFM